MPGLAVAYMCLLLIDLDTDEDPNMQHHPLDYMHLDNPPLFFRCCCRCRYVRGSVARLLQDLMWAAALRALRAPVDTGCLHRKASMLGVECLCEEARHHWMGFHASVCL
jgi:hypothetical protein